MRKRKKDVFQSLNIKVDLQPVTLEVPLPMTSDTVTVPVPSIVVPVPTIKELLESKILWKIVIYSSFIEFVGKMKLKKFF